MICTIDDRTTEFNEGSSDIVLDISGMDVVILQFVNLVTAGVAFQVTQYGGNPNTQNTAPKNAAHFSDVSGVNLDGGTLVKALSAAPATTQQVKFECVGGYLKIAKAAGAQVTRLIVNLIKRS